MNKEEQKERSIKIELTKAKMLLNTENKELAFNTFFSILNNNEISIKYRLEALGYLALNKLSIDEVIEVLKNILLKEELQEFDYITLSRKFKELNKLDELSNIIMEVVNNNAYNSTKRFYLIKLAFDLLNENFKKELIDKITLTDNSIDFLNLISIIKNNSNYVELINSILNTKISNTRDFFNKIIYYNIFANLYGIRKLYDFIIDTYSKEYKIDYIILLYVLLFYFKDKPLLKELEIFIENNFTDSFVYIFFYNLREVLFKNKILYYFLDFEELYNKNRNLFLSFLGFIFTKKLVEDFRDYIDSFTDYRGVIFKRLINSFIGEDMVDIINRFDISNGENEYFVEEQAIIELNEATFDFRSYFSDLKEIIEESKKNTYDVDKTSEISKEMENILKKGDLEIMKPTETEEVTEYQKVSEVDKSKEIWQIEKTQETAEIKEIMKETGGAFQEEELGELKETDDMLISEHIENVTDIKSGNIKEEVSTMEPPGTEVIEASEITEDIISEIEKDIQKVVSTGSIKDDSIKENMIEATEIKVKEEGKEQRDLEELEKIEELEEEKKSITRIMGISEQRQEKDLDNTILLSQQKLEQNIDIDEIIKKFSNLKEEIIENIKKLLTNDLNFKENFFVKLEDYILNENNIRNDLDNINVLFNFIKNVDNTYFSKFLKALIAILLGYDFNTLANIIYSTIGMNKMTLREYFIENELLDFNLSINDFINFVQFIVNNNLESAEKMIPLLVSLTEFKELNDNSKEKINHLISDLIKLI